MRTIYQENNHNQLKELAIAVLVLISFLIQYFTDIIRSNVAYIIVLLFCSLLFALSARRVFRFNVDRSWMWIIPLIMIGLGISRHAFDINIFADYITFMICFIMCSMCGSSYKNFDLSFRIIKLFSYYYAISIWIQLLLPSLYSRFLILMPDNIQHQITVQYERFSFTGFSSNLAFTAGHILLGILLLIVFKYHRGKMWQLELAFFVISLMMTGKRSTFLFLIIALMTGYIANTFGKKRINKIFYMTFIILICLVLVMLFQNYLSRVPVFGRLIETIEQLRQGEDISSSREMIYLYAVGLFKENPIWGIGWGHFRGTTLGNITWVNTVEVHNIYLQLLCEAGIVGFIIMIIPMFDSLIISYRNLRLSYMDVNWASIIYFSFIYQVFFLLYGLFENPLYDNNFLIIYFFSIAINMAYLRNKRFIPAQIIV